MAGILDTIKLAGVLIFAIPAAIAGLEFAYGGNLAVGGALLGLAVGLVVIQHWLTLPTDVPGIVARRVVGSVVTEPDEDREE